MKLRRTAFISLTALSVSALAHAQRPSLPGASGPQPPTLRPGPLASAPVLKTKPIVVDAPLRAVTAQKRLFDPAALQGKLTYVGDVPQLRLTPSKIIQLEPVLETPPAFTPIEPVHRAQFSKYAPHYQIRYVGRARPAIKFKIDNVVHHKAWQTPIRDQGSRGTCVAFASMAGLEWYFKKAHSTTKDLSENHAYNMFMSKVGSTCMADPGIKTVNAADYLRTDRICEESQSPYVNSTSNACANIPAACSSNKKHGIVGAFKFYSPEFGGTGDEVATNTSFLEALVNLGLPVVMGVYVAGSDWSDGTAASGVIDLQKNANGTPAAPYGGHAMLLVGYNSTDDYFIFKNSWGADSGHDGYFHLSYEYLQAYAKYGYVIISTTNPG